MSRTSNLIDNLKPSGIREFFELVMGMDDVISLGVGEPDFQTPMNIRQKSINSIEDGYTNYTSNKGLYELRETISEYLEDEFDLHYAPESEILVTTGVSEALDLAIRAIINPQDEIVIPQPSYISYKPTAIMAGADVKLIQTNFESGFKITPSQLDESINENTKGLLLNYPANPTGVSYNQKQLKTITKILADKNCLAISDEIYSGLTFENSHIPLSTFPRMKDQTILLNGFSKNYAMTGFRIGYAAGPKDIISTMTKIHQYSMLCAPTPSQFAAIEALVNGDRALESMRSEYQSRRDLIMHRFENMGLPCIEPQGAFYAFPSIRKTGIGAKTFCEKLLKEKKVATVPGTAFGSNYKNFIRVSFATDTNKLIEALDRIENFLNSSRNNNKDHKNRSLSEKNQKDA